MDKKETVGILENLLKSRKYTEKEQNQIIDLCNKQHNTIYDKTEKKFKRECTDGQYGLILRRWTENILSNLEVQEYVV